VTLRPRARTALAWTLWLATMAACVAGLVVALLIARPLTAQVLLDGALYAVVLGLGRLLPEDSTLVVAGATLAVAAVFSALRRGVQGLVDRRFNRRRYALGRCG
jgi:hypothetical protein